MNSGKSLSLLTKNFALKEKGFITILMKPMIDDRTSTISTRLGLEEDCLMISPDELPSESILKANFKKPDFILIDEAQFLTAKQVLDLTDLVDNWEINVICYGLKIDWKGNFFHGSLELMKHSDELIQVDTYCKYNQGSPAMYHIKLGGSDSSVETGYEDLYESVSRKKWKEWAKSKNIL
jgi:thymidine kinase